MLTLLSAGGITPSLATLRERTVGIGGLRGFESRGRFGTTELRGMRLDATVRYGVSAATPDGAAAAAQGVIGALAGAGDQLRAQGVLRMALEGSPPAEFLPSVATWRMLLDYRVLYEFPYEDPGGAESLIARIPIDAHPGADPDVIETSVVTDEMVRWDENGAPPLTVRGPVTIRALAALSFLPDPPTGPVTVTRTDDAAGGPPARFGTLDAMFDAVAGSTPAAPHAQVAFASPTAFLAALGGAGTPVALGDWNQDGTTDLHEPRVVEVTPGMELRTPRDRLEIAYGPPALDRVGVIHIRAARA